MKLFALFVLAISLAFVGCDKPASDSTPPSTNAPAK